MKLTILIVNLCIFKLCTAAPTSIQSHHTTSLDHFVVKRGVGLTNKNKLWKKKNGQVIVPWTTSKNVCKDLKVIKTHRTIKIQNIANIEETKIIEKSMLEIENLTCIKFEQKQNQKDFILFERSTICASHVGRIGGKQEIKLASGCFNLESIQHEIFHALGFDHMHSHFDRNEYITFDRDNSDNPIQFSKADISKFSDFGQGYDFDSIMHYRSKDSAVDKTKDVIIPKDKTYMETINRSFKKLSEKDIESINLMYQCQIKPEITKNC